MNKMQKTNVLGIVALFLIIVFIFTQLSTFKDERDSKTISQDFNFGSTKQIQQTELTFETLKQYKGFENVREAEASKQIETIKRLAKVLYYLHINEQNTNNI